jgi:hypothetical protein
MISLLGATYDQYLSPQVSVLVCGSNNLNRDKMAFAKDKGIPAVNSAWLWACVDEARLVDVKKYTMPLPESRSSRNSAGHEATATIKVPSQDRRRYNDTSSKTSTDESTTNPIRSGGKLQKKQRAPYPAPLPPKGCDPELEPRRHQKPLEEASLPRLNSPRRSEPNPPAHANADPDSTASGKATSALAAMLEAKRASRSMPDPASLPGGGRDSDAENHPQLRRKRTLGRAASTGSESMVRGDSTNGPMVELPQEPQQGPAKPAAVPSEDSMLLSQKLIYEDPEMRERREKLLAEIGGAKDVEVENNVAVVTAVKRRGGRSRAKR